MKQIIFSTGNDLKFRLASSVAEDFGVELIKKELAIDEIQGEDAERIACDKTAKAYALLNQPVITSDDSWSVTALRGFPGVYMKSMNAWLSTADFLRLFETLENREIILTQMVVYQDESGQKVFSSQVKGELLKEARGKSTESPNHEITVMDGDRGKTIAEVYGQQHLKDRKAALVWREFFNWYVKQ